MNANYDFQIAKYINCVIQNWLLIPSFYWFSAILLKSFSIVSHITNLPHGWYPHIRSLFASLSYLLSSLSWWLCKNYVHTPTDVINAQWHVKFGLPFPFETHSQLTIVIDLHVIFLQISVVPTKHSDYSHGLVVERNGWKIVYSADTRPCKQLIDAGNDKRRACFFNARLGYLSDSDFF